jgi:hypothetical protein
MSSLPKKNTTAIKEDVQALSIVVCGEPASKANSRRSVRINGRSMFIKSQKALDYCRAFKHQTDGLGFPLFAGDVSVTMTIHYASRRPDLDESLILDLLQGVAYKNDRQVKEKHIYWALDKENPHTEIQVKKMDTGS